LPNRPRENLTRYSSEQVTTSAASFGDRYLWAAARSAVHTPLALTMDSGRLINLDNYGSSDMVTDAGTPV
jgi:hypothetical protein